MKRYAKSILYAYPLLSTVEKDYEEHVKNRAILSYDSRVETEKLAEYIAEEILQMRRLTWLKGKVGEVLSRLNEEERALIGLRYFGKSKPWKEILERRRAAGLRIWTERTCFRRQQRLGEKVASMLVLSGVTEQVYRKDFAGMELFEKIEAMVERKENALDSRGGK